MEIINLFGDEDFSIKMDKPAIKKLVNKVNVCAAELSDKDTEKILKSKSLSLEDRLSIINERVLDKLGKQQGNIIVIKDNEQFNNYINKAIQIGRIAIDTETNNSLDPVTCKLMGLCLYVPGEKQAYIPIHHRNPYTKERLAWQLTEEDCHEQLQRIVDSKTMVIMHNGKFDYEVIKCTCGIVVKPDWDTIVAARLLNENELAGLKQQYIKYIDPDQSKYDIEELFNGVLYADVDPDIFALYAASDAMMTDKLYLHQKKIFDENEVEFGSHTDLTGITTNKVKGLNWLFHEVEMPIVAVTAEMELRGVTIDQNLGAKLKEKYTSQLVEIDTTIEGLMLKLKPAIDTWLLSPDANAKLRVYAPAKSKLTAEKLANQYPNVDDQGMRFKYSKELSTQIESPINLASPTQLAILFYNILQSGPASDKSPRGTGAKELKILLERFKNIAQITPTINDADLTEEEIEDLADDEFIEAGKANKVVFNKLVDYQAVYTLCDLILKRRGIVKLITTYIDVIPTLAQHWPDGRIRFHLNSLGTDTGRYSSGGKIAYLEGEERVEVSGINCQNIPSHNKEIRMLFTAQTKNHTVEQTNNYYSVPETDEVETTAGWKLSGELAIGDELLCDGASEAITKIEKMGATYNLYV